MTQLNYIITDDGIAAIIEGEQYTIARDNPTYGQVRDAIAMDESPEVVASLFRTAAAIRRYSHGSIEVTNGSLFYGGEEVHNVVVDRVFEFMTQQLPVDPLLRFLENLLQNPSRRAVKELYSFLEHKRMPLTPDGCFLAYKAVQADYTDKYSGKFSNRPGNTLVMPRNAVDDEADRGCSKGFHAGSLEYAQGFANSHAGDRLVLVKIDPRDVVSVPYDCSCQKLRTARYEVVADFQGAIDAPMVEDDARPYGEGTVITPLFDEDNGGDLW